MKKVLVVEDDPVIRNLIVTVAQETGFLTSEADDGRGALDALDRDDYGLVILDLMMPKVSGYDVLDRLADWDDPPSVILVTAAADHDLDSIVPSLYIEVVRKPFDIGYLRKAIMNAFERQAVKSEAEPNTRLSLQSPEAQPPAAAPPAVKADEGIEAPEIAGGESPPVEKDEPVD